jgi:ATP-dependent Lhr-like helicase
MAPPNLLASLFHPAVAAWFHQSFAAPTPAQAEAWPAIKSGKHALIAAPTGSGKTLAAFLAAIDGLVRQGLDGGLRDETQVVYVSPLKALSNDIQKNLQVPLSGINEALKAQGHPEVEIRAWVRTGDTPSHERDKARKRPPHIVVTTPESLYILLGSESGRKMLATTRTVIVDEIHALAPNKRGSHLSLSLERLQTLCGNQLLRIGLSATQKPIELVARFLVGAGKDSAPECTPKCTIVDAGHVRARDLAIELPSSPLEAVMSNEVWDEIYEQLVQLIEAHRTTLIFVNTRRLSERITGQLSERIGEANVAAHHGSLSKEHRLKAEQRLKGGELKALVATASLELGIDIGDVDLVCQIGSPRSIASFLQRVGRSGHAVGGTPKGRLFPLSRDELVECTALLDSVRRGELDTLTIPEHPLDVLAQQIVAESAAREWSEEQLFALMRRAWPYRDLPRKDFNEIVAMLGEGFSTRRGRRGALLHHDAVNGKVKGRRGARLTALTSGGAIPDNADYRVILEPENQFIGSVNEDFAVESLAGDVFQLGNRSYRILRVERGTVRVEDAHGMPPNLPFWLGEAPGRSDELSQSGLGPRAHGAKTK